MWPLWVNRYGHKGKNHSSEVQKTDIHQIKERGNVGPLCVYFSFELLSGFIIDIFFPFRRKTILMKDIFFTGCGELKSDSSHVGGTPPCIPQ